MTGIVKHFGAVHALGGVDLFVENGGMHAIIGENGAGKTTLMRVLYGGVTPDAGSIEVDGHAVSFRGPADAIEAGIGMVSQHYGIVPGLSCLENLILGAEPSRVLDLHEIERRAQALADKMGFRFDWAADAASLSPSSCQKLELLKLLWKKARIMILDEPTAMLSPIDSMALFENLRKLADEGATIILVTHRLADVLAHCRQVTVLRAGIVVADRPVQGQTAEELSRLIIGGETPPPVVRSASIGSTILSLSNVTTPGERLKSAILQVHEGEILGVAGVDGSGQRELVRVILRLERLTSGVVTFLGQDLSQVSTRERIRRGMRLIAEDRQEEAVISEWSLEDNATLGLQRLPELTRGYMLDKLGRARLAEAVADRFSTRHGGLQEPIATLSGGNQQRFVAARSMAFAPKLIVAFQPARGLDVLGTEAVYRGLREACDHGAGCLVISFDLDELLVHCDRIVTLFAGRAVNPAPGKELDRDTIGLQMVGAA